MGIIILYNIIIIYYYEYLYNIPNNHVWWMGMLLEYYVTYHGYVIYNIMYDNYSI